MIEAQIDALRAPDRALSSVELDELDVPKDDHGDLLSHAADIHAEAIQLIQLVRLREGEPSPERKRSKRRA